MKETLFRGDYAERLPFTVLLDDVAGGADNVVVVRRRAQPVSEPADYWQNCSPVGLITSVAVIRSGGLLLPVLLHMEATTLGLLFGESYIFIKHCALKPGVFFFFFFFFSGCYI